MRPSRRRSTEHSALTTLDPSRESHRQPRVRASGMGGSQKNAERFKRIFLSNSRPNPIAYSPLNTCLYRRHTPALIS